MSKNRMTSWERRQRRRIRIMITVISMILIAAAAFVMFTTSLPYEQWNLSQFYNVTYSGYNNNGAVVLTKNGAAIESAFDKLKKDYRSHVLHRHKVKDEDYEDFLNSLQATVDANGPFSNGSTVPISYQYDEKLAEKLMVEITGISQTVTVSGLPTVSVLTKEDLFGYLQVTFEGISPEIKVRITNSSPIPFVQDMQFLPVEEKPCYANGDVITVRAVFDEEEALKQNYVVDVPPEECWMSYTASSSEAYLTSPEQLTADLLKNAETNGLFAFDNANEFGVRIYCEANLVPVYIDKMATFEWLPPSARSIYFKTVKPDRIGVNGNYMNELDVVYDAKMIQADGVSCSCYAVVRYTNLIQRADGSIDIDFSNPKIVSADYKLDSIHKSVVTMRESDYNINKVK